MTQIHADPSWLKAARNYIGLKEIPGAKHNSTILGWLEKLKAPFRDDETPWCGSFVGAMMLEGGRPGLPNPWGARNWLKYGKPLDRPAYGCIVVFWRGSKSGWSGHVGFVVGKDSRGRLMVLGANQSNMVRIDPFDTDRVLGYRWPNLAPHDDRYNLPLYKDGGPVSTNEQ